MAETRSVFAEFRFLTEIERYELFLTTYSSAREDEFAALETAMREGDPLLKTQLLQYLEEIPESRSLRLILIVLDEPNEFLRLTAMRAYQRNHFTEKAKQLRPFLLSQNPNAARFAIRTLSRAGDRNILAVLLRVLPDAVEPIQNEILSALRYLPDERSVPILTLMSASKSEETRYRAVRSLAELKLRGVAVQAESLLVRVDDPSARVREAALTGLKRYSSAKIAHLFLARAVSDTEPHATRLGAVEALAAFPRAEFCLPLLSLMVRSKNPELRLSVEISLRRFPGSVLKSALGSLLVSGDENVAHQAAVLLAECVGFDPAVRKLLLERWRACKDEPARIKSLSILRELGGPEVVGLLLEAIAQGPTLAYLAIGVINRFWTDENSPKILELLRSEKITALGKQSLLTALVRREPFPPIREELLVWLLAGLKSPVMNIRYLSLQTLAWYPLERSLGDILTLLTNEESAEILETARRQIVKGLGEKPIKLVVAVREHPEPEKLAPHLGRMLAMGAWDGELAFDVLYGLLLEPVRLHERVPSDFLDLCLKFLRRGSLPIEKLWLFLPSEELRLEFLRQLCAAMRNPEETYPALTMDFLAFQLKKSDAKTRGLYYELLALNGRPEGIALMTETLLREADAALLASGREHLGRLIWETAR